MSMTKTEKPVIYQKTTLGVTITVTPHFLEEQSSDDERLYVWAYIVRIENDSSQEIKLIDRHWEITDDTGFTQMVDGKGVIGEQPIIESGNSYEYASGAPLSTPSGMMVGYYTMKLKDGTFLKVAIPAFSLDSDFMKKILN